MSPKPEPGDDTHGVIPDIVATDAVLAPYRTAEDPVLALALDVARHGTGAVQGRETADRGASGKR